MGEAPSVLELYRVDRDTANLLLRVRLTLPLTPALTLTLASTLALTLILTF